MLQSDVETNGKLNNVFLLIQGITVVLNLERNCSVLVEQGGGDNMSQEHELLGLHIHFRTASIMD